MIRRRRRVLWGAVLSYLAATHFLTARITSFVNFETAPVHPIELGPDGRTLALCNLPDNRLELFDVSSGVPVPTGTVAVGLDPVSVRFASSNELWVVNHISSTINIVDLLTRMVVATIETPPGPSDLVFAGNPRRAWISCSRVDTILVVDPSTRLVVTNIAIDAERPRAMATSPDGSKVYVAIFESGNGTTVIGPPLPTLEERPEPGPVGDPLGPYGGADPPPNSGTNFWPAMVITNTPPRVSHLVRKNAQNRWMDDNGADWTEWVSGTNAAVSGRVEGWDLPDHDVAVMDTATSQVSYIPRLMNICMAIGVNPISGKIAVVGTEATNERRFEPVLNGVFLRVNIALVDPLTHTNHIRDLNPHLDYITRTLPQEQRALSLGDPRGIQWSSDGARAYITGMGSRNLIVVNSDGERLSPQPLDVGEGPTGMALDETRGRLYVWNRFSSTISVVNANGSAVIANVSVFDPTPEIVRRGRRHLYDGRRTSGLGITSCASCHVDARGDRLAWDLGNPAGNLVTNANFAFHPMKGPMVTQTLQDIITPALFNGRVLAQRPLHWRGDRKNIEEFNPTFKNLQANDVELTANEMAEFKAMLASIFFPPNYLRTFSNSLPTSLPLPGHYRSPGSNNGIPQPLPPGNARRAFLEFEQADCRLCHGFDQGLDIRENQVIPGSRTGTQGAFKSSQLRSVLDKIGMDRSQTNSRAGFGFLHDGSVDTVERFIEEGFPEHAATDQALADMVAFLLSFTGSDLSPNPSTPSQDVPAAAGKQVTFSSAPPPLLDDMFNLALRTNSRVELVLRGPINGVMRNWLLRRSSQDFQSDRHGEIPSTMAAIIAVANSANPYTAMLVPEGTGIRTAVDRDGDGYFDASEVELGFNPADPVSHPGRIVSIANVGGYVTLSWESASGARYTVEVSTNLLSSNNGWTAWGSPVIANGPLTVFSYQAPEDQRPQFHRIRMEP